jgi:hypothetical protein
MRKLTGMLAFAGMFALAAPAFAQSSGNVATDNLTTVCEVASNNGSLSCINPATGASAPCPTLSGGSSGSLGTPLMTTTIQTPSGSGTALIITPSFDTGLFTKTKVSATGTLTGTDTAESGILVQVTVDGNPVDPEVSSIDTTDFPGGISGVMYDERFQQLSTSNLACFTTGGCSITLILSSLSAHSFNFTAPNMTQGNHTVNVYAQLVNTQGSEMACVGPGSLTVVQAKAFQQNQ